AGRPRSGSVTSGIKKAAVSGPTTKSDFDEAAEGLAALLQDAPAPLRRRLRGRVLRGRRLVRGRRRCRELLRFVLGGLTRRHDGNRRRLRLGRRRIIVRREGVVPLAAATATRGRLGGLRPLRRGCGATGAARLAITAAVLERIVPVGRCAARLGGRRVLARRRTHIFVFLDDALGGDLLATLARRRIRERVRPLARLRVHGGGLLAHAGAGRRRGPRRRRRRDGRARGS